MASTRLALIQRLDEIECDLYRQYVRIERMRLELQREWHVLPSGERWTEQKQQQSESRAELFAAKSGVI